MWISINERLPKVPTTVLVWHKARKTVLLATLYNEGYRSRKYHWNYCDVGGSEMMGLDEVSHWMPLPKSPNK